MRNADSPLCYKYSTIRKEYLLLLRRTKDKGKLFQQRRSSNIHSSFVARVEFYSFKIAKSDAVKIIFFPESKLAELVSMIITIINRLQNLKFVAA